MKTSEIKAFPLLYSTPMVVAYHKDLKYQTRRIHGEMLKRINENLDSLYYNWKVSTANLLYGKPSAPKKKKTWKFECAGIETIYLTCPYGEVGDVLYGRERLYLNSETNAWHYYADQKEVLIDIDDEPDMVAWAYHKETDYCTSMHMPKFCSRMWHRITNVRLERLHEITEADAIAEGIDLSYPYYFNYLAKEYNLLDTLKYSLPDICTNVSAAVASYATLWEAINGKGTYAKNPYIWVIEYEPIDKPTHG